MQFSFAQEKTVTGVVSDNSGPLPGANVVVQGSKTGTQTDVDGKFSWTSVINPSDDFYTHAEKLNYEKSDYISIRKNSD